MLPVAVVMVAVVGSLHPRSGRDDMGLRVAVPPLSQKAGQRWGTLFLAGASEMQILPFGRNDNGGKCTLHPTLFARGRTRAGMPTLHLRPGCKLFHVDMAWQQSYAPAALARRVPCYPLRASLRGVSCPPFSQAPHHTTEESVHEE